VSNTEAPLQPFVDLWAQHAPLLPQLQQALAAVVHESGFIRGRQAEQFEQEFAAWHGVPAALGVASGTDALVLAARALNLQPGDEVISVPNTWISTIFAISYTGATPVLVDVDPVTHGIDVAAVARAITPRTKAVFAVHLFGQPVELTALAALCQARGLLLVEDVAQATGARHDGQLCGTVGDIGCFSFFPSKNLGCLGDGGAVITRHPALAERLRRLANYGMEPRHQHHEIGYNSRLDTLQAAFLSLKLPHLAGWNAARRHLAARYTALLQGLPLSLPQPAADSEPVYHLYVIQTEQRDALLAHLQQHGVMAQIHYPRLVHEQPCYAHLGYQRGAFPVAERLNQRILSLPIYPEMTAAQQDYVVAVLRNFSGFL
jgi:dTDP-4-amino-4,6-dideoxygalactose transaminase